MNLPLTERQRKEVDEAMAVFVQTMEAMGLTAIVIVDGRDNPACMFSKQYEDRVLTLLASTYCSVQKRTDKAN